MMKQKATSPAAVKPAAEYRTGYRRDLMIASLVFFLIWPLTSAFQRVWLWVFCLPSANLSAAFIGARCLPRPDGFALVTGQMPMMVSLACSASTFFAVLLALMVPCVIGSFRTREVVRLIWLIPCAWLATILANTARIVSSWHSGILARSWFPESYWASIHMGTGVVVFTSVLVAIHVVMRRIFNERSRRAERISI